MDPRLIHSGMTKCGEAVIKIKGALIFLLGGEDLSKKISTLHRSLIYSYRYPSYIANLFNITKTTGTFRKLVCKSVTPHSFSRFCQPDRFHTETAILEYQSYRQISLTKAFT